MVFFTHVPYAEVLIIGINTVFVGMLYSHNCSKATILCNWKI